MTGSVTVPRPILLCNSTNTVRATDRLAFSWGLGLLFERATADGAADAQSVDRAHRVRRALGAREPGKLHASERSLTGNRRKLVVKAGIEIVVHGEDDSQLAV